MEVYSLVNIQKDYGQSQSLMGKSTISMAIFNSKLLVYPGIVILRVILRR